MKLIDANVFIYALGKDHPYKEPCERVLGLVKEGRAEASVDVEMLQEILHYYHSARVLDFGVRALRQIMAAFPNPLAVSASTVDRASGILLEHGQLQARDAVHAAVVLENDLEGIITADRGFEGIPGVKRFDPKEF